MLARLSRCVLPRLHAQISKLLPIVIPLLLTTTLGMAQASVDISDFPERIEREQIGVAGDDEIGMAVDGQLKKFVASGVGRPARNWRGTPLELASLVMTRQRSLNLVSP
jgi:hypothetical protein